MLNYALTEALKETLVFPNFVFLIERFSLIDERFISLKLFIVVLDLLPLVVFGSPLHLFLGWAVCEAVGANRRCLIEFRLNCGLGKTGAYFNIVASVCV